MAEYPYALFDAFTDKAFGGSVAAIVANASGLSAEQMQQIAIEFAAPATGFVTNLDGRRIDARFFSTQKEYPMCGHGTIGMMTWLIERGDFSVSPNRSLQVSLKTPSGEGAIKVTMDQNNRPEVMLDLSLATFDDFLGQESILAGLLGIEAAKIDRNTPIALTRSDFTHLLIPIVDLETMRQVTPDFGAIKEYCLDRNIDTFMLFCLETLDPDHTAHCREFCPAVGTLEAPASGTTNRAVASYLTKQNLISHPPDGTVMVITEQGYEMGRPSIVRTALTFKNGLLGNISVGGLATKTMEGTLFI